MWQYNKSESISKVISFHSVFCLTTGSKPPPKWFLHIVRSRASSFEWEYPLLCLSSSSSFIRLLPRLLVISISAFIFPSITCFRRQFPRKMWPIQLAFRFLISCRIFLCSLTLSKVIYISLNKLYMLKVVNNTTVVWRKYILINMQRHFSANSWLSSGWS